ncbi:hypothetical protein LUZ60_000404 [Juncus effusus]|nr:hypothetical protein LUZ60_000404 [Juncus effusus]
MSIMRCKPLIHQWTMVQNPSLSFREQQRARLLLNHPFPVIPSWNYGGKLRSDGNLRPIVEARAAAQSPPVSDQEKTDLIFSQTFPIERIKTTEGNVSVKLEPVAGNTYRWRLVIGCNLKGKWVLHWGVTYDDDLGSEWDQPPPEMRPDGSVPIKDYAVETPLREISSSSKGQMTSIVQIEMNGDTPIVAINFVLKEEEKGAWFQHKGRDFRILLRGRDSTQDGNNSFAGKSGAFGQISSMLIKTNEETNPNPLPKPITEFEEEYTIFEQEKFQNSLKITVNKENERNNVVEFETDIPDQVIVHWGVSMNNNSNNWEIPNPPYPNNTKILRKKALQTLLEPKIDGSGNKGTFTFPKEIQAFLFVLKLDEFNWINNKGTDFYIPLLTNQDPKTQTLISQTTDQNQEEKESSYTKTIITGIQNLVTNITSQKSTIDPQSQSEIQSQTKEDQETILQEIEKLVAEAYNIFRSSRAVYVEKEEPIEEITESQPTDASESKPKSTRVLLVHSGTGTGHEILCQGFNWESHKSGKWYIELGEKARELKELGFSIVWLPPPTESVSPEGYMPKDLYNLNSRYGTMEQLKEIVRKFHDVEIKVLGDVVLNHRCASYQNQNGIWNLYGGKLSWDERAVVGDDPHFQGKGNKSSGDNFHAAPNIDHSQDFVRNDLKEWLNWLRNEVGYDGWRLDFVRGFWGGYVKDYLESSSPYFAVGEYWDSLSYTYNEMDYNQDAHRQRIIDWINATSGKAGAFDVTTKGILHTALVKCEYWRLRDEKGKPPGVLGWWPSRAVTFVENHDTGSTQGHWRFPSGKEMQGYAYILTHPGTPAVFFDHIFSHFKHELQQLISLRRRNSIHCRSLVKITKAERDVYAAEIDEKIAMKIGPGFYEPGNNNENNKSWSLVAEGNDYKVWEAS